MTCEEFQSRLAERIGSGEDFTGDQHFRNCAGCRALLSDLNAIAEAARELFPIVEPPEELWVRVESAIRSESGSRNPEEAPEP